MKKLIFLMLMGLALSGCTWLQIHKRTVVQGNVITPEAVNRLHRGMTETDVKRIMGQPILINLFTPNRMEYVYTFQPGNQPMTEKRVSLMFSHGRLEEIQHLQR